MGSFSPDVSRLLQLCDEEDDATSGLAALKPDPDGRKAGENAAFHDVSVYLLKIFLCKCLILL